ncbi:unannotated protein [freshwater metagenome]|uniref:Unannotated protein n=1 Tax=freshwater metagenome TaxID=449393 RepID=A0A6J7ER53_9ZZZZ
MIAVCLKWVDQRLEFDEFGAPSAVDSRFAGTSGADQAALEWALRCRESWATVTGIAAHEVVAVTVGPAPADAILLDALRSGADRAIRIDLPFGASSRTVAACIAAEIAGAELVWCGDYSLDRGTGSVPAFLAAELGVAQALGLVGIDLRTPTDTIALRRLDGGRRERLSVNGPAVLSVEGSTALLRRAPLRALIGTRTVEVVTGPPPTSTEVLAPLTRPYRPRPRVLTAPVGATALDRVRSITDTNAAASHGETVVLGPEEAAERILVALRGWGYRVP